MSHGSSTQLEACTHWNTWSHTCARSVHSAFKTVSPLFYWISESSTHYTATKSFSAFKTISAIWAPSSHTSAESYLSALALSTALPCQTWTVRWIGLWTAAAFCASCAGIETVMCNFGWLGPWSFSRGCQRGGLSCWTWCLGLLVFLGPQIRYRYRRMNHPGLSRCRRRFWWGVWQSRLSHWSESTHH